MKYEPINDWMSHEFHIIYKSICQTCFWCTILMYKTYELWMKEFCTLSIIKSWNAKFVMHIDI
jgi:hypothetical protein